MIPAIKTGMLWVDMNDLTASQVTRLYRNYTYQHPREPDQDFCTLIQLPTRIGIPAGDIEKLKLVLPNLVIDDHTVATSFDKNVHLTGLTLRPYQHKALEESFLTFSQGTTSFNLSGEPGSGKSVMLSAIIAKLGVKTLIIAHLSMLVEQLRKEIEQFTDAKVTVLNKDSLKLGDINIATSQFISQRPELWYKIKKTIGLIAVDEAETIASESTLRILQRAHAKYRIAVTATFTRSVDGRTPALTDMIGHKVITLENDKLLKPTIISVRCEEVFDPPMSKNRYKKALSRFFTQNRTIDEKVLWITKSSVSKNRQVLIAVDLGEAQRAYAEQLTNLGISCAILNGNTKKSDREQILDNYNKGQIKVLIGFGVLNAGLSIPKISVIIRVSTPANPEKLEQLIGRGRRDFPGKEGMWLIDLVFGGFSRANSKRYSLYQSKKHSDGWSVYSTTWNNFKAKLA